MFSALRYFPVGVFHVALMWLLQPQDSNVLLLLIANWQRPAAPALLKFNKAAVQRADAPVSPVARKASGPTCGSAGRHGECDFPPKTGRDPHEMTLATWGSDVIALKNINVQMHT